MLMRSMLLHILIILKILISEKTLEQEKLRNERGKRRNGHTRTSNGTPLLTSGKIEKFTVYLKEHGLTTIGRKLDKVKAIRCHYYQHIKESANTERMVPKMKVTGNQGIKNMRKNSTVRRTISSDNDFVFKDLDEKSNPSQTIQFITDDQISEVVVQGSRNESINIDVTRLHIVTLAICAG